MARATFEIGQQEEELVTGETSDRIGFARADTETFSQLDQQLIAGVVAQRVVDELEVVEIEEQDANPEVEPARTSERAFEHLLEQRAVRQTGQLVVVRQERDLLLGHLALRDVEDHALDQPRLAVAVVDRERLLHHPLDRAVLVHHPVLVVQRDVGPIGVLVLLPNPVDVVDVDVVAPAVRILQPGRRLDPQEVRDLWADVDAVHVLVDRIQVHHRGDLLYERPVLGLCLEPSFAARLELGHVAERDHQEPLGTLDGAHVHLHRDLATRVIDAHGLQTAADLAVEDVAREQEADGLAHQVITREAGQRLRVVVREHDPAVIVGDHQALGRGLQQRARLDQASQPSERRIVGVRDLFDLR